MHKARDSRSREYLHETFDPRTLRVASHPIVVLHTIKETILGFAVKKGWEIM